MENGKTILKASICLVLLCSLILPAVIEASDDYNYGDECNVGNWTDIKQVAAGQLHTVGLKSDGTMVAVGDNWSGECGVGNWTDITQVDAGGEHTVGLKEDGTVVAVGENHTCNIICVGGTCEVGNWTDIVQVSAGGAHTVGLKSDGTAVAVGYNEDGRCDVGDWTDIVQLSAGLGHTVGVKEDGTAVAVGENTYWDFGQCDVEDWTDIIQVAAGGKHTVGLKEDGTVVAEGPSADDRIGDTSGEIWNYGQCDVEDWANIKQVAAGVDHTVGLMSNGTVVAVGDNWYGQCDVGNWTDIIQVAAGSFHTVGLRSNGTVLAVGGFIPGEDKPESPGSGCFIATAAYGTPMAEEIRVLREFRDEYLLTSPLGKALVEFYYRVSPPIAEFITEHPSLKPIVRAGLVPAVGMSTIAVHTSPAEKMAIGSLVLISVALAIWATRRREYT